MIGTRFDIFNSAICKRDSDPQETLSSFKMKLGLVVVFRREVVSGLEPGHRFNLELYAKVIVH
jgi:hypothetical protein